MEIHIARDGRQFGPFPQAEVQRMLDAGELRATDLAWTEGLPDWVPLAGIPGIVPPISLPLRPSASGAVPPPIVPAPYAIAASVRALPAMAPPTSGLAIASLILGVVSIGMLPLVTSIPAVICGHLARGEIKRAEGRLAGDGLAVAGLITGYFWLALSVLMVVFFAVVLLGGLAFSTRLSNLSNLVPTSPETDPVDRGRQVGTACRAYATDHKGAFPEQLDKLFPKYLKDHSVLINPLGDTSRHKGYVYLGGRDTDPKDKVLCYSMDSDQQGRRVVVRVDGSARLEPLSPPVEAPDPR